MIYMDNAATTIMHKEVIEAMKPFWNDIYANPSGVYEFALKSKKYIENARIQIAQIINASPEEIYFTSGGTESDNWAINSAAKSFKSKGNHIVTTQIEHPAVLNTCRSLEKSGYEVTYVGVNKDGIVNLSDIEKALRKDTILISVMYANNEIGTIQPINEIGRLASEKGIAFHTDAVQAYCQIPIDVKKDKIDMLSLSGHKFNGPKGVGALYVRKGVPIVPFMNGGAQERRKRAGTSNVPGIVGMGCAATIAASDSDKKNKTLKLRDYFIESLKANISDVMINGTIENRLPGNVNVSFKNVDGTSLLVILDENEICASAGSACSASDKKHSHVLKAINVDEKYIGGTVRFTLSERNTKEEIDKVIKVIKYAVDILRVN